MYNRLAYTDMTADTAICACNECNTVPVPTTQNVAVETYTGEDIDLAQENAAQRQKIAELEAMIERLKTQHADELKAINEDRKESASCMAQRLARADAEREELERRADMLEFRVEMEEYSAKQSDLLKELVTDRADKVTKLWHAYAKRARKAEELLQVAAERTREAETSTAEQDKPADGLDQPTDNQVDTELAVETVLHQDNQVDGPEQPTDNHIDNELADETAEYQNNQVDSPEQPADKCSDELTDETVEFQDKATKQSALCCQVEAATKKTNIFKATVGKVARLLRAHQRKLRSSPPKPESDCNNSSKKRMSFFEHIGQSATLCTMATPHTSAGSRF
ncbi:hypothetical protein LPJ76_005683 [Coemansia sp. RSA 638]|nr:hypothetical protein LPJ76_005683 [Coemansia sp. RSA 638]